MNKLSLIILTLITFSAIPVLEQGTRRYLVVWNIGQGQWVTAINDTTCFHFDTGGEFFPWKKLKKFCGNKENQISLSHWDSDHINGLKFWPNALTVCLAIRPLGKSSAKKTQLLAGFADCDDGADLLAQTRTWDPSVIAKDTNSNSHVIKFENALLPGDSPQQQEKIWKDTPWLRNSKILVLGHHGSRTSTSTELLANLPELRLAIASARWARYKHPHPATLTALQKYRIPLLRTEDWGNIWLER